MTNATLDFLFLIWVHFPQSKPVPKVNGSRYGYNTVTKIRKAWLPDAESSYCGRVFGCLKQKFSFYKILKRMKMERFWPVTTKMNKTKNSVAIGWPPVFTM